jgi:GldM C-terminal domain
MQKILFYAIAGMVLLSGFLLKLPANQAVVSADKMNVLYIGVDNQISIASSNAAATDLQVTCQGIELKGSDGNYIARVSTPGDVSITVMANGVTQKFPFRAKRIPNPTVKLSNGNKSSTIGAASFAAQTGLIMVFENCDLDIDYSILEYDVVRVRKGTDHILLTNKGPRFDAKTLPLIAGAKAGDTYLFENIKIKCPGDNVGRNVGSLTFVIR